MNALTAIGGFASEHSPAILVGVGIIGFVATVVTACKQTTKLSDILDEAKAEEDQITNFDPAQCEKEVEYTEEDRKNDLKILRRKTTLKIIRNYAVPAAIGIASIAAILCGFKILNGRYLVATSAYATLEKLHERYRERIRDKYGDDADRYGETGVWHERKEIVDEETGETKVVDEYSVAPEEAKGNPFYHQIGPGDYLYEKFGGDLNMIEAQAIAYLKNFQVRVDHGEYVNVNRDVMGAFFPGDFEKLTDIGQISGWCARDKNSNVVVDLGIGRTHTTTMDGTKEIEVVYICPNAKQVSFANINAANKFFQPKNTRVKVRKGGKYISQNTVKEDI